MDSREKILTEIRKATTKSPSQFIGIGVKIWCGDLSQFIHNIKEDELIEHFSSEFTRVGGFIHPIQSIDTLETTLGNLLEEKQIKKATVREDETPFTIGINPHSRFIGMGVKKILEKEGIDLVDSTDLYKVKSADAGITVADFGIALTGTLVEITPRNITRITSLVPPIHIALLKSQNIVPAIDYLLPLIKDINTKSVLTFITGPSRTADIEQVLTVGVHGPKEVHLILLK